jgi:hypothetical protein
MALVPAFFDLTWPQRVVQAASSYDLPGRIEKKIDQPNNEDDDDHNPDPARQRFLFFNHRSSLFQNLQSTQLFIPKTHDIPCRIAPPALDRTDSSRLSPEGVV